MGASQVKPVQEATTSIALSAASLEAMRRSRPSAIAQFNVRMRNLIKIGFSVISFASDQSVDVALIALESSAGVICSVHTIDLHTQLTRSKHARK
jgi:hypothetical protein